MKSEWKYFKYILNVNINIELLIIKYIKNKTTIIYLKKLYKT